MKFGIFMGPFHRAGENPTLALERDLALVQWLDYLDFAMGVGRRRRGGTRHRVSARPVAGARRRENRDDRCPARGLVALPRRPAPVLDAGGYGDTLNRRRGRLGQTCQREQGDTGKNSNDRDWRQPPHQR